MHACTREHVSTFEDYLTEGKDVGSISDDDSAALENFQDGFLWHFCGSTISEDAIRRLLIVRFGKKSYLTVKWTQILHEISVWSMEDFRYRL